MTATRRRLEADTALTGLPVDEAGARAAYGILVEEAGARDEPEARERFVRDVAGGSPEHRFGGGLGFGGKFRNDGQGRGPWPYVTCYPEDRTPSRAQAVERANARLRSLFGDASA